MSKTIQPTTTTVKKRRKYDDAYKQQALQMLRLGQSVPTVAQVLGISQSLLYKWQGALQPMAHERELEQLRQRLKQVETERDILKKALRIFCRPT